MSSAKHSVAVDASDRSIALAEHCAGEPERDCTRVLAGERKQKWEQDWLCADLSDGLHALAQPLTILRSALAMLALVGESGADHRRYLDLSIKQIDRTCGLYASIRNLVASRLEPAQIAPFDLCAMLARTIEYRRPALQGRGVAIAAPDPGRVAPVFGDLQRTEQAISVLLETASRIFSRGDVLEVSIFQSGNLVEVRVEGKRTQSQNIKPTDRLDLSLVKSDILSQHGTFRCAEEPFRVTLGWPVDRPDPQGEEAFSEAFTH
jgi:hypothetical protein